MNVALVTVAGVGVIGWVTLSDPVAATCCATLADVAGLAGVMPKIWRTPHSETAATYGLAGASGVLCAVTAGSTEPAVLIFPVDYLLANLLVTWLIVARRAHPAPGRPPSPVDRSCPSSLATVTMERADRSDRIRLSTAA